MAGWYNSGKTALANGGLDFDTTDVRALLVRTAYTFNPDHNFVSDVVAQEVTGGTGYARKSTTRSVVENDTNDRAELNVTSLTWTAANFGECAGLILYVFNAADSAATLVSYHEFTSVTTNGGDLTVSFSGNNSTFLT